jgi:diguanylate cyclase (GGDEF)-like protein
MDKQLSHTDDLSGLYNRRYLKEKEIPILKASIKKNVPFSLAWFDLDHFKEVNDIHGHIKGDEVIREFAQFLRDSLRNTDILIRYGGDEFICILPNTTQQDAAWICQRILNSCKEKEIGGLNIMMSIGIAAHPDDGTDIDELLQIADAALYDAKRSGRGRIRTKSKKHAEIPMKAFVNRIEEKEQLNRLIMQDKNQIRVAIVKGNIGIGKTRLVKEALSRLKKTGVVWCDCLSLTENIAYYPIRELIKYRIRRSGVDLIQKMSLVYRIELGKLVPEAMEGIETEVEDIERVVDKYRLYESVRQVMEAGEQTKIVVIDNIQWIDKDSIEVMKYLFRSLRDSPMTFVLMYRVEEKTRILEDFIAHISRENDTRQIELKPFAPSEVKASVQSIIGEEPDKGLIEYAMRVSGGNPYYIEEIVRDLVEYDYLMIKEDNWIFKEPDVEIVPKSIEGITIQKYDSLSKEAQDVLKVASTIGWFDIEIIRGITGYNESHIIGLIEGVSRLGMTKERDGEVIFKEELSRNAIYRRKVEGPRKRILHRKIAELIEKQSKERKKERLEELAFHYYRSQDAKRGISYCVKAGDMARDKYANRQAIKYYTWAIELFDKNKSTEKMDVWIDCLLRRAMLLTLTGDSESAMKDLEEGLKCARAIKDKKREITVSYHKSLILLQVRKCREAIKEAQSFRSLSEEINDKTRIAVALDVLSSAHSILGEQDKAMEFNAEALDIFRQLKNSAGEAGILNNIGIIHYELAEFDRALQFFEDALNIARKIGEKIFVGNTLGNIGNVHSELENYAAASQFHKESIEIAREVGNRLSEGLFLISYAADYIALGKYETALKTHKDALEILRETGHKYLEGRCLNGIGNVHSCMGDYNTALKRYESAHVFLEQDKRTTDYADNLMDMGNLYLALNQKKKAEGMINKAYEIAKDIDAKRILSNTLIALCDLHLENGELEKFKKSMDELKALQEILKSKGTRGQIETLSGRYCIKTKDSEKMNDCLDEALHIFEGLGDNLNIGKVYYYKGIGALAIHSKSICHNKLSKSLEIFDSLGANGWKKRTEKALALSQ